MSDSQRAPSPSPAPPGEPASLMLNWGRQDIENRIGLLRAGRYTSANQWLGLGISLVSTGGLFAFLSYVCMATPILKPLAIPFVRPGNLYTTVPATFLFLWALVLLVVKRLKLAYQERALALAAMPQNADFVLNEVSARAVLDRLHAIVDHPRHFILLNRIDRALSNLRNIGGLGDVSTILKSQAENDENQINSSYTFIGGMVWAIPVLGFIGTVQGLSAAIATFAPALAAGTNLESVKANLQNVTVGLATAFETTLVALVMALVLQLFISATQKRETDFLDECNDYCHQHVIARLRLVAAHAQGG